MSSSTGWDTGLFAGGLYGAESYMTEQRMGELGSGWLSEPARPHRYARRQAGGPALRSRSTGGIGLVVLVSSYFGSTLLRGRSLDLPAACAGVVISTAAVVAGALLPAALVSRADPASILRGE